MKQENCSKFESRSSGNIGNARKVAILLFSILIWRNNLHCNLCFARPKLRYDNICFCSEPPFFLMNPMHHPVTMAENHGFLPRGVEGQAKKLFCIAISGKCQLGAMKALETSQLIPIRSPGTSCWQSF